MIANQNEKCQVLTNMNAISGYKMDHQSVLAFTEGRQRLRPWTILTATCRGQKGCGNEFFIEDCKLWGV